MRIKFRLLSVALILVLTGCATSPESPSLAGDMDPLNPATIRTAANAAFEWQMARIDDPDSFLERVSRGTRDPRGWVQGAFLHGATQWARAMDNQDQLDVMRAYMDKSEWKLGDRLYHADDHAIAQSYLTLFEIYGDDEMLAPLKHDFDAILNEPPVNDLAFLDKDGIRHRYPDGCQRRWCWADALFMSPPVWFRLEAATGDERYGAYGHQEYQATVDHLFDDEAGLFYRDDRYYTRRGDMDEKIFWSRGNGWVFAGLTSIIDAFEADDSRRIYYLDLYRTMAKSLLSLQGENGTWPMSLHGGGPDTLPETSGTGFFIAGLAWGMNNGILTDEETRAVVVKGWKALLNAQQPDGKIGWVQQIGGEPAGVKAEDTQFYGVGAFLLAAKEMYLLVETGKPE